jgi:uncharacterized membrane protein YqjE
MEPAATSVGQFVETSKGFVRRLFTTAENRLELLMVEVQEERERLLHVVLLALGVAVFGLLAGMTLTAAIILILWHSSPVTVLLTLTGVYGAVAIFIYRWLTGILRDWKNLPATFDQLKKDRACLEKHLT